MLLINYIYNILRQFVKTVVFWLYFYQNAIFSPQVYFPYLGHYIILCLGVILSRTIKKMREGGK